MYIHTVCTQSTYCLYSLELYVSLPVYMCELNTALLSDADVREGGLAWPGADPASPAFATRLHGNYIGALI